MDSARADAFDKVCQRLRQISRLKERERIDENEYQKLREALLLQLHQSIAEQPHESSRADMTEGPQEAYGDLHETLVKQIEERYRSAGADSKQRMVSDMMVMAERQALYPGDTEKLTRVIDVVSVPLEGAFGPPSDSPHPAAPVLLKRLADTNRIAALIRYDQGTSPSAKAIAETAQQSVTRAAEDFDTRRQQPAAANTQLKDWWYRHVVADLEGAFQGGAAAVVASPAFTPGVPWAVPMVAAFGVLVGAGIRSGSALAEG